MMQFWDAVKFGDVVWKTWRCYLFMLPSRT